MKLQVFNEEESWEETSKFIESKWTDSSGVDVLLSASSIYQRGKYIIVEYAEQVYYSEHNGHYCYIEDALNYINPERPAKWKTVSRLITFRKALRENTAQGMGLDDLLKENISFKDYQKFIRIARVFDERHHGSVTF
jgi:hypothetical protein